jgi:hypothetical protein
MAAEVYCVQMCHHPQPHDIQITIALERRHLCNELEGHVFGQIFVDYFAVQPGWWKLVLRVASLPIPSLVLQPEIF